MKPPSGPTRAEGDSAGLLTERMLRPSPSPFSPVHSTAQGGEAEGGRKQGENVTSVSPTLFLPKDMFFLYRNTKSVILFAMDFKMLHSRHCVHFNPHARGGVS